MPMSCRLNRHFHLPLGWRVKFIGLRFSGYMYILPKNKNEQYDPIVNIVHHIKPLNVDIIVHKSPRFMDIYTHFKYCITMGVEDFP